MDNLIGSDAPRRRSLSWRRPRRRTGRCASWRGVTHRLWRAALPSAAAGTALPASPPADAPAYFKPICKFELPIMHIQTSMIEVIHCVNGSCMYKEPRHQSYAEQAILIPGCREFPSRFDALEGHASDRGVLWLTS